MLEGAAFGGIRMDGAHTGGAYATQKHYYELLEFVDKVIDVDMICQRDRADWKAKVGAAVWGIIDGVRSWGALWRTGQMGKVVDVERAGVVAFRF